MATLTERLFWVCLFVGLYPYAIYPLCVAFLKAIRPRTVHSDSITPTVTVVISAYNEAPCIEATVRNKLAQDYPQSLLDVMVASDASNDGTDEVLSQLARQEPRVTFFRQEPRGGKTTALNAMVQRARGDIIVFADANSMYDANTVRSLVAAICGPEPLATRRVAWSTSMRRDRWSATAVRRTCATKTVCGPTSQRLVQWLGWTEASMRSDAPCMQPMRADQLPDFVLPLAVVEQGHRVVFAPQARLEGRSLGERVRRISHANPGGTTRAVGVVGQASTAQSAALPALQLAACIPQAAALFERSASELGGRAQLVAALQRRGLCGPRRRTGLRVAAGPACAARCRYAGWLWLAIVTTSCF